MEDHFEYESVVAAAVAAGRMGMSLVRKGDERIVMKTDLGVAAIGVVSRIPTLSIRSIREHSRRRDKGMGGRGGGYRRLFPYLFSQAGLKPSKQSMENAHPRHPPTPMEELPGGELGIEESGMDWEQPAGSQAGCGLTSPSHWFSELSLQHPPWGGRPVAYAVDSSIRPNRDSGYEWLLVGGL